MVCYTADMSLKKVLSVFLALVLIVFVVFFIWSQQVSPANKERIKTVRGSGTVSIMETDHSFILRPTGYRSNLGLVFVPGGRVAPDAYIYKLSGLAESLGMTVVITKPYFNLAFFDFRPFNAFTYDVGGIDRWYVGGHSLGGVRSCGYATEERSNIRGIVLFAAYCDKDVSLHALTLRGEKDGLVSDQDIRLNASHLLEGNDYYEIEGANHASFGDYGLQDGDGKAEITPESMRNEITGFIGSWTAIAH